MSDSDVYGHQIRTYIDGPSAERVDSAGALETIALHKKTDDTRI